jgi:serine/threonine protein kinase
VGVRAPLRSSGDCIGDFVVHDALGMGGVATVYRARHRRTLDCAAVKTHEAPHESASAARSTLRHEAHVLSCLDSAHAPQLIDLQLDGPTPHLAMTIAGRETLANRLHERGALDLADAVRIITGAAESLQSVHDAGILHLDLAPANLVLADDGAVRIVDFGASHLGTVTPGAGSSPYDGTAGYAAPERCFGARPSATMDVFSLAAVAYRALIGTRAYIDPRSTCPRPIGGRRQLLLPFRLRPEIGPELSHVLVRSLSLRPDERATSAAAFADEFARALPPSRCVRTAAARGRALARTQGRA